MRSTLTIGPSFRDHLSTVRDAMLSRGLVTLDRLRQRGVQ
jgi:hypothetical protein